MKNITALLFVLSLAACADSPPPPVKTSLPTGPALNLDVRTVSLADRNGIQPADSPYYKNDFHPTIAEAIRQWAGDRLKAVGSTGDAIVIIKDASLTAQPIPHTNTMFKREQAWKYTAHADVEVEIKGGNRGDYALASASSSRFETLAENPSLAEKQNAYAIVLNGVMQDLNRNLEASIREHMAPYLVTAPIINGDYGAAPPPVIQ